MIILRAQSWRLRIIHHHFIARLGQFLLPLTSKRHNIAKSLCFYIYYTVNPKYLHILCLENSLFPPEPSHNRDFLEEGTLIFVDYGNSFLEFSVTL